MSTHPIKGVVYHLRRAVLLRDGAGLTDAQLLDLFVDAQDEAAFEALVRRHSGMVMGTCRRLLGNHHDAEDAFQATFLVLARKAASVVPREMLANWLYGVAHTTALRVKVTRSKRWTRERQVLAVPEPEAPQQDQWSDVRPWLDRELSRLPDKYRIVLVLCDLEGKSIKDAARILGWPQGTVAGRLSRARTMLAKRLARHGPLLGAGSLAAIIAENASAAAPISLVASLTKPAMLMASSQSTAAESISAEMAALTKGVMRTMSFTKLKIAISIFLIGSVGLSLGMGFQHAGSDPQTEPKKQASAKSSSEQAKPIVPEAADAKLQLPIGPSPKQALVSLEAGKVKIRTIDLFVVPKSLLENGQPTTFYEKKMVMGEHHFDADALTVYDMKGHTIAAMQLPIMLKKETLALVTSTQWPFDPRHFQLYKEGTLLFAIPGFVVSPAYPPVVAMPAPVVAPPMVVPPVGAPPVPVGGTPKEPPTKLDDNQNKKSDAEDPKKDDPDSAGIKVAGKPWANKLFKETTKDFGVCEAGAQLKHSFKITNIYAVPLEITKVRVSCGCLDYSLSRHTLNPQETVTLDVTVDSSQFSGAKTMTVHVLFGPDYKSEATLVVKAQSGG